MPRAAQEPQRLVTRSMAHNTIRRSARLRNSQDKGQSSFQSSLPQRFDERDLCQRIRKPKRPSTQPEGNSQTKPRHECGQIEVRVERRAYCVGSCDSGASRDPSAQITKPASCHQGSLRVRELEEQLGTVLQAKEELDVRIKEIKVQYAQSTLKHLEEYFTCPLCFEIMACPYTLTPRNCGHTFCATCILKWFFSRLHKGCGGWHEAVDCPLCRSALPHTPDRTPRSISCFPFIPNRTADIAVRGFINAIAHELAVIPALASNPLWDWNEDGHSKQEWCKRERTGRTEMTSIAQQWNALKPTDFVSIKNRLEV